MFYLYAVLPATKLTPVVQVAFVAESETIEPLVEKMQVERMCWSDEGIRYAISDYQGKRVLMNYDDMQKMVAK